MSENEPQTWEAVAGHLPVLLNQLTDSNPIVRDSRGELPMIPERGIYVFCESGKPLYVGRTDRMRERILEHGRPSSLHNSATFAFLLAMKKAKCKGIDCTGTRDGLQIADGFKPLFDQAKDRVRNMQVMVVKVDDAIEQSVFRGLCGPASENYSISRWLQRLRESLMLQGLLLVPTTTSRD